MLTRKQLWNMREPQPPILSGIEFCVLIHIFWPIFHHNLILLITYRHNCIPFFSDHKSKFLRIPVYKLQDVYSNVSKNKFATGKWPDPVETGNRKSAEELNRNNRKAQQDFIRAYNFVSIDPKFKSSSSYKIKFRKSLFFTISIVSATGNRQDSVESTKSTSDIYRYYETLRSEGT